MASEYYNLNSKHIQLWSSISMTVVFVFIGVPIWWKTTEVYRADLPYSQIAKLSAESQMKIKIIIDVHTTANQNEKLTNQQDSASNHITQIQSTLSELLTSDESSNHVKVQYDIRMNPTTNDGIMVKLIEDLEANQNFVRVSHDKITGTVKSSSFEDYQSVLKQVARFISESFVQQSKLDNIVLDVHTKIEQPKHTDAEHRRMQTIPASSQLDILFSVLCPEPHVTRASWNIDDAVTQYIDPILNKLKPVMDVEVGSQVLLYASAMGKPLLNKTSENDKSSYYITERKLSRFVNPIEARLGSQQSPNPTLNFVVYLTPKKYCPLHIQLEDGSRSTTNTFLVPRWGAVTLYNECTSSIAQLKEEEIMRTFMAQFKQLLGIDRIEFNDLNHDCKITIDEKNGFHAFELEHFFLSRTVEQVATAKHTLSSISNLLEKITNIVINDHVADNIYNSVHALMHTTTHLATGHLPQALNHSNQAFRSAEQAFYDPTILELLYFPEDQKFAIYVPLFLPISIPLVTSFVYAMRTMYATRKQDKGKCE